SYFFFQAEDGIRDLYVTGVQTCALPILKSAPGAPASHWFMNSNTSWTARPFRRSKLAGQQVVGLPGGPQRTPGPWNVPEQLTGKIGRASCRERGEEAERADPKKQQNIQH